MHFLRKTVHLSDLYPELACSNTINVTNNSLCRMGQIWSRVNFVTIFGDLYQIKLWGICNNFNQFTYLSSIPGRVMTSSKWRPSHNYNAYILLP